MDFKELKELMQNFDASGIYKMSLEVGDVKIKLEKEPVMPPEMPHFPPMMPPIAPMPMATAAPTVSAEQPTQIEETPKVIPGTPVKSPVVGTFYPASAPGAQPFVTVGQKVEKGQTLCIVEAMKMMNEITAPVSGTVTEILVKEEDMVQFDQTIMMIQE